MERAAVDEHRLGVRLRHYQLWEEYREERGHSSGAAMASLARHAVRHGNRWRWMRADERQVHDRWDEDTQPCGTRLIREGGGLRLSREEEES